MSLPIPLPGETVYGFMARVCLRSGARSWATLLRRMGIRNRAALDSPLGVGIGPLFHACPDLTKALTPDAMVWNHTICPLYIAFSRNHRTALQRAAFSHTVVERGGWAASPRHPSALRPEGLRVCSDCQCDDVRKFGVAYWHREHQIGPVAYCWRHGTLLKEYRRSVGVGLELELPGYGRYAHAPLDIAAPIILTPELGRRVAVAFASLLDRRDGVDPDGLQSALFQAAHKTGLLSRSKPSWLKTWQLMLGTFGSNYLQYIHCPTTYSTHRASRYVRALQVGKAVDPVVTVLLAVAFDVSWEQAGSPRSVLPIETSQTDTQPVHDVELSEALSSAGYVLHRAKLALGVTRNQLRQRIVRAGLTCPIVFGRNAKFDEATVRSMIEQLKQGVPRSVVQQKYFCSSDFMDQLAIYDPQLRTVMKSNRREQARTANKEAVTRFIADHRELNRQLLWAMLPGPMSHLVRHDLTWLRTQLARLTPCERSAPGRAAGRGRLEDSELDRETEVKLRRGLACIETLVPPRRRTVTLALRLSGLPLSLFAKLRAGRLPRCEALLVGIEESAEDFIERKLDYAFAQLARQRHTVTALAVRRASGLPEPKLRAHRGLVRRVADRYGMPLSSRAAGWLGDRPPNNNE